MHTLLFVAPILLSAMRGFVHVGQFVAEMLLCEQTYDVIIKGEIVAWYDLANKEGLIRRGLRDCRSLANCFVGVASCSKLPQAQNLGDTSCRPSATRLQLGSPERPQPPPKCDLSHRWALIGTPLAFISARVRSCFHGGSNSRHSPFSICGKVTASPRLCNCSI